MDPNYYPGKPPEEQPTPVWWKNQPPSKDEVNLITSDHRAWVEDGCLGYPPHMLSFTDLGGIDFHGTDLSFADFSSSCLKEADFWYAKLEGADLNYADLRYANLEGVDLTDANVAGVKYNRKTKFLGSKMATAFGSPKFLAFARHQEFLEELRLTKWGKVLYRVWLIFADCGRTPWYWILWSVFFCLGFAGLYWYMQLNGTPAFHLGNGLPSEFFTMLYFSVVTFTTLGFGDVTPVTLWARVAVMTEVVIGYAMLGGLISIFATLITRRS